MCYRVAIVVDPIWGERLVELSRVMHVWAVRSPEHEAAADSIWGAMAGDYSAERGLTLFNDSSGNAEAALLSVIDTVELHHGEDSHDPPLGAIEVIGTKPTPSIREAFATLGFDRFEETDDGFVAYREPASASGRAQHE